MSTHWDNLKTTIFSQNYTTLLVCFHNPAFSDCFAVFSINNRCWLLLQLVSNIQVGIAMNSFPGCPGSMVDMSNKSYWFHAVEIKTCRQGKEKWDLLDIMLDPKHFFFRAFDMSLFITLLYGARKHLYSPLTLCIINLCAYQEFPMHRVKSTWNFPCPYSITFLHEHMAFRTDPAHNLGPSFFLWSSLQMDFSSVGP